MRLASGASADFMPCRLSIGRCHLSKNGFPGFLENLRHRGVPYRHGTAAVTGRACGHAQAAIPIVVADGIGRLPWCPRIACTSPVAGMLKVARAPACGRQVWRAGFEPGMRNVLQVGGLPGAESEDGVRQGVFACGWTIMPCNDRNRLAEKSKFGGYVGSAGKTGFRPMQAHHSTCFECHQPPLLAQEGRKSAWRDGAGTPGGSPVDDLPVHPGCVIACTPQPL